jgi:hypothetical protein
MLRAQLLGELQAFFSVASALRSRHRRRRSIEEVMFRYRRQYDGGPRLKSEGSITKSGTIGTVRHLDGGRRSSLKDLRLFYE